MKKSIKKLSLSKHAISRLNELNTIKGGISGLCGPSGDTCGNDCVISADEPTCDPRDTACHCDTQ